ncbi:hypothetical protein [Ruegeria sp. Ofav3-42]|uniref:hypothetical protein n=1 Tax=Ruegeria sp. Ofav3-42 TaxID=2917759 RepID=UPI001EF5F2BD|nr:hypothetical protein [Ruegeria sp. Ofav3-42]MCG7519974.1 hypothetical protein [Ruegeria sp. Ofav3-42]
MAVSAPMHPMMEHRDGSKTETDVILYDGRAGLTGQLDNGLALALSLGVFRSDGNPDTKEFYSIGLCLDASLGQEFATDSQAQFSIGPDLDILMRIIRLYAQYCRATPSQHVDPV